MCEHTYDEGVQTDDAIVYTCTCTDDPSAAILYGDIDDNGVVDAADARLALRISVRLDTPNAKQKKASDVDFNGAIDAADARRILRASVRLEDPFSWTKE